MRLGFLLVAATRTVLVGCLVGASSASAQDIFVTPVPNAPFTGVIHVERSLVQPDGSRMELKTVRNIARDSHGRIHQESRQLLPSSSTAQPKVIRIHLYDPESRISTWLDPRRRTCWTMTVNHPPGSVPPAFIASTTGSSLPQNDFAREEDLGTHEIEGLAVHGVRQTQTISASGDRGKEVVVTDEYWYSEDLRINLIVKHSDPRNGTVTLTVAQIARTEPEPALFEIPEGYTPPKAEPGKTQ
jgi:hypothetical protein